MNAANNNESKEVLRARIRELQQTQLMLEKRVFQLETLYEIGNEITSSIDLKAILQVITSALMGAFGVTKGISVLASEDHAQWDVLIAKGTSAKENALLESPESAARYYQWFVNSSKTEQYIYLKDENGENMLPEHLIQTGIQVWVPFEVEGGLVGGLGLANRLLGDGFSQDDLNLLKNIVDNSVIRLRSARLFLELLQQQREQYRIRGMFEQFLAPSVVDMLLDGKMDMNIGGENRRVSVLMADLRGSTPLIQSVPPSLMVQFLNEFLSAMTDIIFRYEGTVDKFTGDGVMAVFGAPVMHDDPPDDITRAVLSGVEMQRAFAALEEKWHGMDINFTQTGMGIGICTGHSFVGNVGSSKRFDHTVIGPTVNLAARLSGVTNKGEIFLDLDTYDAARAAIQAAEPRSVRVKGFSRPVDVYALTAA